MEALYIDGDTRLSSGITEYQITTDGIKCCNRKANRPY